MTAVGSVVVLAAGASFEANIVATAGVIKLGVIG